MVSITVLKKRLLDLAGARPTLGEAELEPILQSAKVNVESYDKATDELVLEITGDRPDLLSCAGVARALAGITGNAQGLAQANYAEGKEVLFAEESALAVRPAIACAIVRNARFDDDSIAEFFNYQEKLALTHGRKRKKVSVGAWDITKLTGPFYFRCVPGTTKFKPLTFTTAVPLEKVVESHPKGMEYSKLLPKGKFPVLQDSKGEIIALIPVSNGVSTSITTKTTSFGIDAEGTDFAACNCALAMMCQDFLDQGATVETVTVKFPDRQVLTPQVKPEAFTLSAKQANSMLGTSLTTGQIVSALKRCRLDAAAKGDAIGILAPAYRADFIHPVDLVEEVAIGHGLDKFEPVEPRSFTKGSVSQATKEENWLRDFLAGAGFLEVSTHVLTNELRIRKARSEEALVEISNPVSTDYHALRGSLLPNLLGLLSENTHQPYPQRIFEVGEVVVPDASLPEKMRTVRRVAVASAHSQASLTEVASVLLEIAKRKGFKLLLKPVASGQYIAGRSCKVEFGGKTVGVAGEVHPQVLSGFGVLMPIAAFEIEF